MLQADGGTRAASITAASIALSQVQASWLESKQIHTPFILDNIAALSVGVIDRQVVLDPDYVEDAMMDADFNIVVTRSGHLIELQGGAEKRHVEWSLFDTVTSVARTGIAELFTALADHYTPIVTSEPSVKQAPLFSLHSRFKSLS